MIALALFGSQFLYGQQREPTQHLLLVQVRYDRYIVVKDTHEISFRDLRNTPIVPSEYRDKYNRDTIYLYIGESFVNDTVSIYRKDSLLYTGVVTSDPIIGLATSCRFPEDKQDRYIIVQLNDRKSEKIYIYPDLYFIHIDYDRAQDLMDVRITNRVYLYK